MNNPITPDEVALFRALIKSAMIVMLMLRLGRPAGARELADILGLDEHTVARYLRQLSYLNIVARSGYRGGYVLLDGRQLVLGGAPTVENLQLGPSTTARYTDIDIKDESLVIEESARTVEKLQFKAEPPELSPVERRLQDAGIGEPKRSALACLSHVTPEYINAWEVNLKHTKGKRYSTGLLIHVLECGDPAPLVNDNGHHPDCDCEDCQRIKYREWSHLGGRCLEDDEDVTGD